MWNKPREGSGRRQPAPRLRLHMRRAVAVVLAVCAAAAAQQAAGAAVCPGSVPRAAKHMTLTVAERPLRLPDGRKLPQLAYNGSQVGPPIVLTLGDDFSIDVTNDMQDKGVRVHVCTVAVRGPLEGYVHPLSGLEGCCTLMLTVYAACPTCPTPLSSQAPPCTGTGNF